MMRNPLVRLTLIALFATSSSVAGEVDPACISKVRSVGPAAWQEAASRMNDIEYTLHKQIQTIDSTHKTPATTTASDYNICLLLAKGCWLIHARRSEQKNDGAWGENEEYKFEVMREKNNQENIFKLVKASKKQEKSKLDDTGDDFRPIQDSLAAAYTVLGFSLNKILTNTDYELVLAKFIGEGTTDNRPIRLEWKNVSINGQRLWAELSSQNFLVIERCGVKNPDGFEILRDVKYQPYGQSVFPKTVATTLKFPRYTKTETLTIEAPHACTRSDAEFFLPYYGISESVVDITRTSSWVRTAAIVLSLVGVAISIYFYRLSRKPTTPKESRK